MSDLTGLRVFWGKSDLPHQLQVFDVKSEREGKSVEMGLERLPDALLNAEKTQKFLQREEKLLDPDPFSTIS